MELCLLLDCYYYSCYYYYNYYYWVLGLRSQV